MRRDRTGAFNLQPGRGFPPPGGTVRATSFPRPASAARSGSLPTALAGRPGSASANKKNGPATQGTLQVGRAEAPQRLPLCHAQRPAPAAQPVFQVPAPNITAGRRKATETRPGRGRLAQGYCGMLAHGRWRWRAGSLECRAPAPSQSGPRGGGAGGEAGTRDCWKRRPPSPRMDPLTAGESQ